MVCGGHVPDILLSRIFWAAVAMNPASFPLEVAAGRLGVAPGTLSDWLRRHPRDACGRAYFGRMGRVKLFTEDDIGRILAALRKDVPCSNSIPRGKARRTGGFAAPMASQSVAAALTLVRELTSAKKRRQTSATLPSGSTPEPGARLRVVKTSHQPQ
jgi:hypothetical protein